MSDNIETKWIAVPNLLLDIENPRLDPVENQHAAIFEMMDKEGESIIELTKSLIEMGYVPYELPIVYPNAIESGTYIVKEGLQKHAHVCRLARLRFVTPPQSQIKDLLASLSTCSAEVGDSVANPPPPRSSAFHVQPALASFLRKLAQAKATPSGQPPTVANQRFVRKSLDLLG